jgi:hypothetical protein
MSARKKLNTAYIGGSIAMAAAFGAMAESWLVFVVVLVVLLSFHLYEGNIRTKKDPEVK